MANYTVLVGNIGKVYDGGFYDSANDAFHVYQGKSVSGIGRASNEPVTLMRDGEILKEYTPESESDE